MSRWMSLEQRELHVGAAPRRAPESDQIHRLAARAHAILAKRLIDIGLSLILIALFAPCAILIAVLIKASSRGPVVYRHRRIGRNGRIFDCLKFRTMRLGAERQLPLLLEANPDDACEWRSAQKLRCDPRITPIGHFLRRTSLDELPQLINIVRGDMSLVGPRPVMATELERYGQDAAWYLSVRPGLTGPWQVSGRSLLPFEARVRLDTDYIRNWSLAADADILVKTPQAVLKARGDF